MSLNQLKKQLKQQNRDLQKAKSNRQRWFWILLSLTLLMVVAWPAYQQHQLSRPQRLFSQAEKLESLGQTAAADELYRQVYQDYPHASVAPTALLQSARLWQYLLHQDQQALFRYLQLEHDYPDSALVLSAREAVAQITKYALRDYSRAIVAYQRLLDGATARQDHYLYEIADCYFRLDNYSQARNELETLERQYPQSELLPELLYRKGGLLLLEKRPQEARKDWQRLLEDFPDNPYQGQARFNLARLLEESGQLSEALQQYQKMADFPQPLILEEKINHLKQRLTNKQKGF